MKLKVFVAPRPPVPRDSLVIRLADGSVKKDHPARCQTGGWTGGWRAANRSRTEGREHEFAKAQQFSSRRPGREGLKTSGSRDGIDAFRMICVRTMAGIPLLTAGQKCRLQATDKSEQIKKVQAPEYEKKAREH